MIKDLINALTNLEPGVLDDVAPRLSPGVWNAGHHTKVHRDGDMVWIYCADLEVIAFQASEVPRLIAALFEAYLSDETDRENHQPDGIHCQQAWPSSDLAIRHFCTLPTAHHGDHRCSCGAKHLSRNAIGLRHA